MGLEIGSLRLRQRPEQMLDVWESVWQELGLGGLIFPQKLRDYIQ